MLAVAKVTGSIDVVVLTVVVPVVLMPEGEALRMVVRGGVDGVEMEELDGVCSGEVRPG